MSSIDLLVRGGTVVDGSGAEPFVADVAVAGGRIVGIGRDLGAADREIDADGAVVTPGFVDVHTHYDGWATWAERIAPSCHHGVTTAVMGNCGVGFAPVRDTDHALLIELMEGVEDIPGVALHEGLPWAWESFPDYLDFLGERRFDVDLGAQLPHAALRVYVMGQRGADREPATAEDAAQMRALTAEAMRAGAIGVTTSRSLNHRSVHGDPIPSLRAEEREMVEIASGLADAGRGVIELISDFDDFDAEFGLCRAMAQAGGRPMTISVAQGNRTEHAERLMAAISQANDDGLTIRAQVAPRPIGILLGLQTTLNPFRASALFAELATLPHDERVAALRREENRAAILGDAPWEKLRAILKMMRGGENVWELGTPPDYEQPPDRSLAARAASEGRAVFALMYDLMLEADGTNLLYMPFANYAEGHLDFCGRMIEHEHTIMGLGDGGAHVGTICDASFATTLLTHWGRDRTRGARLPLPLLVRKQTFETARAACLDDRGLVAIGKRADLNVIDFDTLRLDRPEIVHDLPTGGARLEQRAKGYLATIVRGEVTYESGEATGALPGRLVRPGVDAG